MLHFTYYVPAKVALGRGSVDRPGELLKDHLGTVRVLKRADMEAIYCMASVMEQERP